MGIKAVLVYDPETKELDHFMWEGKGDPPPLIKPKMKKKRRPKPDEKPDVS